MSDVEKYGEPAPVQSGNDVPELREPSVSMSSDDDAVLAKLG
jgi:hypothetical protein